jgi:diguanylate cyclase (GGDEF)-like protein
MQRILTPIIEITRQRDLKSLEKSLLNTVGELIPCISISICKLLKKKLKDGFEEALKVDGPTRIENTLSEQKCYQRLGKDIKNCMNKTQSAVILTLDKDIYRLLIPIHNRFEDRLVGVVRIDSKSDLVVLQPVFEALVRIYENYVALLQESEMDRLTGLLNRRTFDSKLDHFLREQQGKQQRYVSSCEVAEQRQLHKNDFAWLAMIDIDHFKRVNDTYGHLYGDEVLLQLSQIMKECFRDTDILFRFGGEEFIVILEPIPMELAHRALQRFSKAVASYPFSQIGQVTVTIGYEKIAEGDFAPRIMELADKALYYGKEAGRNCIHNYSELLQRG